MDNLDLTIEEYIELYFDDFDYLKDFENKFPAIVYNDALTLGPEISSEPTVMYFEDIDYFKDFKNEFPAIVYKDALTPEPEVSSEPTGSAHHAIKVDFDFKISFDESDDEDYTVIYDNDLFCIKYFVPMI
ncbi:hypothetical protein Tco_0691361 [Tanacetum coccineum]